MLVIELPCHDKTDKISVHKAKTRIGLDIRLDWSESSLITISLTLKPRRTNVDATSWQEMNNFSCSLSCTWMTIIDSV